MSLRIAMTGSTGLVGSVLLDHFTQKKDRVTRIVREQSSSKVTGNDIIWNIDKELLSAKDLEGHDAVIHLAGANIAAKRWSEQYKKSILDSRIRSTHLLCSKLSQLKKPPKVLLTASAIGYYGNDAFDQKKDEESSAGEDFLASVCQQWEKAAEPARAVGIRVVALRIGTVLSLEGGALGKMFPIFKAGLGGTIGSGAQPFSWIALDEFPGIVDHLIAHPEIKGAVNLVSPNAVSNAEFTKVLGQEIHRPTIFPLPAFMVKVMFGEMGQALLLGGVRVVPKKLEASGYPFRYPDLKSALAHIVKS